MSECARGECDVKGKGEGRVEGGVESGRGRKAGWLACLIFFDGWDVQLLSRFKLQY